MVCPLEGIIEVGLYLEGDVLGLTDEILHHIRMYNNNNKCQIEITLYEI